MFDFLKPTPLYCVGTLVKRNDVSQPEKPCYILLRNRRFIKPNEEKKKQWVYDGVVLDVNHGQINIATHISCVFERNIECAI